MATFGSPVALPLLSNLQSLADGAAKPLGQLGTAATGYVDRTFTLRITTGVGAVSSGQLIFFFVTAENATPTTDWTDGINPTAVVTQHTKITGASLSQVIYRIGQGQNTTLLPSTTYTIPQFSVLSVLGFRPTFLSIVAWNQTGGALSATASDFSGFSTLQT